ncbi:MAG: DUF349 domain-containing protein [Bacteroidales bacterium]|nr:DUF349 domain-containing protein [Bacteroidales bacterium]
MSEELKNNELKSEKEVITEFNIDEKTENLKEKDFQTEEVKISEDKLSEEVAPKSEHSNIENQPIEKVIAEEVKELDTVKPDEFKQEPQKPEISESDKLIESTQDLKEELVHKEAVHSDLIFDDEEEINEELYSKMSKEELVQHLEELVKTDNIIKVKARVAITKSYFYKIVNKEKENIETHKELLAGEEKEKIETEIDPLVERYNEAFKIYKEKKRDYEAEQERIKLDNFEKKKALIEELKVLIDSDEHLKKVNDDFRVIQEKWKEIGQVPVSENKNLWENYHHWVERFYEKVKINRELKDLDLRKNMERQIELCAQAEELLLETSIIKSFKRLQKLHEEWKEVGPVPSDKKEELWERFRRATESINTMRREYYDKLYEEQQKNLLSKTALCEKAEFINTLEYNTPQEWKEANDKIMELYKIWKTIGYAPKKDNENIWKRFMTAIRTFNKNRNDFYGKAKEEFSNNYNLKLNICIQAEAIKDSTDWRNTTKEFLHLQEEWKKVGPVNNKAGEALWKRFRAACDVFFSNKFKYFENIEKSQEENLKAKQAIIQQLKELEFSNDNAENLKILKDIQKQWTEIGFVPIQEKDKLQEEYSKLINGHFEKLKLKPGDKLDNNYKAKYEGILNNTNGERNLSKEMGFLLGKISAIQNDINLWENNIGFLANSKNADLLKEEFNGKINNAKEQIRIFQEKINYLKKLRNSKAEE